MYCCWPQSYFRQTTEGEVVYNYHSDAMVVMSLESGALGVYK